MFYSSGMGGTPQTAQQSYSYFTGVGFTAGYYVNGPPSVFRSKYVPFAGVINLKTGVLMLASNSSIPSASQLLQQVIEADR